MKLSTPVSFRHSFFIFLIFFRIGLFFLFSFWVVVHDGCRWWGQFLLRLPHDLHDFFNTLMREGSNVPHIKEGLDFFSQFPCQFLFEPWVTFNFLQWNSLSYHVEIVRITLLKRSSISQHLNEGKIWKEIRRLYYEQQTKSCHIFSYLTMSFKIKWRNFWI